MAVVVVAGGRKCVRGLVLIEVGHVCVFLSAVCCGVLICRREARRKEGL